ncbi:MAG: acyl-CoA thioesterase domain-containing protein, partial [Dietzia sp.]
MSGAFYQQVAEGRFESSPLTAGPWSPDSQHAGPPSALLVRAMERLDRAPGVRLSRVSVDVLGP